MTLCATCVGASYFLRDHIILRSFEICTWTQIVCQGRKHVTVRVRRCAGVVLAASTVYRMWVVLNFRLVLPWPFFTEDRARAANMADSFVGFLQFPSSSRIPVLPDGLFSSMFYGLHFIVLLAFRFLILTAFVQICGPPMCEAHVSAFHTRNQPLTALCLLRAGGRACHCCNFDGRA